MASLKHGVQTIEETVQEFLPRVTARGLIEAPLRITLMSAVLALPRVTARGLIEAYSAADPLHCNLRPFHELQLVASLKHAILSLSRRIATSFHELQLVASLKLLPQDACHLV